MSLYSTLHLHNTPTGRESDYAAWFDGPHRSALAQLRGFRGADRFETTPEQIGDAPQPWRYMSVYDFDLPNPQIDIPALGPLLGEARDAGLVSPDQTERVYTYSLYSDWKASPNWRKDRPFPG